MVRNSRSRGDPAPQLRIPESTCASIAAMRTPATRVIPCLLRTIDSIQIRPSRSCGGCSSKLKLARRSSVIVDVVFSFAALRGCGARTAAKEPCQRQRQELRIHHAVVLLFFFQRDI